MADIFEDGFVDTSQHTYRDFSVPNTDPFGVSIFANTDSDGVPTSYSYSFNQAYAFNAAISGDLNRASGVISGMEDSFTVPVGEDVEFKVGLKINKQNFIIQDAVFYTGEPSQEGEDLSSGLYPIFGYKSEDNDEGKVYTGIYQVCTVRDGSVITRTTRDNIYLDNIQIKQLGVTGAPSNGEGGLVHLIQESGQYDSSVPINFRGISGGSGIQLTYDTGNASGGNYIVIDSSAGGGGNYVGNTGTASTGAKIYVTGTNTAQLLRSLTGENIYDSNLTPEYTGALKQVYVVQEDSQIKFYYSSGAGGGSCANVGDAADVYVEGTSAPFNFRSLTGAKNDNYSVSDLADVYASVDGNKIQLYSEPWNGENLGSQTAIFKEGNGTFGSKAQFKTLEASTNITFDTSTTDVIKISAAGGVTPTYSNLGAGANVYDESSVSPNAGFRSLTGDSSYPASSAERNKLSTVYAVQEANQIVLKAESWEGENIGAHGENVYKNTTGPASDNKAQFRKISGVTVNEDDNTSSSQNASVNVETVSDVIKISVDLSTAQAAGGIGVTVNQSSLPTGSFILGGTGNSISGHYNVVTAGALNNISGNELNFIGGGSGNDVNWSRLSSSLGGENNDISGSNRSVLLGGKDNLIHSGGFNFLGGGQNNKITGTSYSSIVGGEGNLVTGLNSVLAGGNINSIFSDYSFIGGGESNIASGEFSIIAGGEENKTFSTHSVVLGGQENTASGIYSFVGAGKENKVLADYGFAAGRNSTVSVGNSGAFVLSDAFPTETLSSGANTLTLNFKSGVYVDSDSGIYINGNPVLTGVSGSEGDTLQIVTDRGATTTNDITISNTAATLKLQDSDGTNQFSRIRHSAASLYFYSRNDTSNGNFLFYGSDGTDNTERMRIEAGGDVGIGTNNPAAKLHINSGHIRMSDGYKIDWGGTNARIDGSEADNRLRFFTSSVEQMRITSDGNVGIGTTNPDGNLHVETAVSSQTASTQADELIVENSTHGGISILTPDASRAHLYFNQGAFLRWQSSLFTIDTSNSAHHLALKAGGGNVGIGTTAPAQLLDVYGSESKIALTSSAGRNTVLQQGGGHFHIKTSHTNGVAINNNESSAGRLAIYSGTAENIRFASNGDSWITGSNVGIGTTNPSDFVGGGKNLVVGDGSAAQGMSIFAGSSHSASLYFAKGTVGADAYRGWVQYRIGDDRLDFGAGGGRRMSLNGNGLAIGDITSPSAELEISSSLPAIRLTDSDGTNQFSEIERAGTSLNFYARDNASNGRFVFLGDNGTSDTEFMRIETDGNVEIGDNKKFKASTYSSSYIKFEDDTKVSANSDIIFDVNGSTELMRLEEGGNVGIGINVPSTMLHVAGTGTFHSVDITGTSTLTVSGKAGIGTASPAFELDVSGTIHGTSGNFENGITIDGNPVVTGTSAEDSDTLQTVTTRGNSTTNNIIINNAGSDPDYGALTITGGYALAHLRSTGTVAYLQFQNSSTNYGLMSNDGLTVGMNGLDGYVTNREAQELYLGTSGEARMAIRRDGKVGIGTLTPSEQLHVYGGDVKISDGTPVLTLHDTSSSALTTLTLDGVNTTLNNAGSNGSLIFSTESTEAMRIDEDGNVGIGTNGPSDKLDVAGALRLTSNISFDATKSGRIYKASNHGLSFHGVAGSQNNFAMFTPAGQLMIVNPAGTNDVSLIPDASSNGGNVGIGTSAPSQKLEIKADATSLVNQPAEPLFVHNDGNNIDGRVFLSVKHDRISTAQALGAGLKMTAGAVTAGTASYFDSLIFLEGAAAGSNTIHTAPKGIEFYVDNHDSAAGTGNLYYDLGDLALTIAEDRTFEFKFTNSTVQLFENANDDVRIGTNTADAFHVMTNGSRRITALAGGNVGIGTTNPAELLEVDGNIKLGDGGARDIIGPTNESLRILANPNASDEGIVFSTDAGVTTGMFIQDGNNVGIGTNNPAANLNVVGHSKFNGTSYHSHFNYATDGTEDIYIRGGKAGAKVRINDSHNSNVLIADGGGDVGIGSVSPTAKLDIKQTATTRGLQVLRNEAQANTEALVYFTDEHTSSTQATVRIRNDGAGDALQVMDGSSAALIVAGDGEVGIGTNDPQKAAHLYFDGNDGLRIQSTDNHAFTQIMAHNDYSAYIQFRDAANRYWIQSTTDDKLRFRPNASSLESATINFDATGNVGIGVVSPTEKLEVGTNTDVSAVIGKAHVGYMGYGDYAGFSHVDMNATNSFALLQYFNGETYLNTAAGRTLHFQVSNSDAGGFNSSKDFFVDTDTLFVDASEDRVGIGTSSPSSALEVVGHFSATTKSFLIDHPTKENKKLQYGSLEGPENGVYVRGTTDEETIELPEYWSELVHDESITVVLTPIGKKQDLFIIKKSNKLIKIGGVEGSYDYVVYGERKDIDRLEIEPDGN